MSGTAARSRQQECRLWVLRLSNTAFCTTMEIVNAIFHGTGSPLTDLPHCSMRPKGAVRHPTSSLVLTPSRARWRPCVRRDTLLRGCGLLTACPPPRGFSCCRSFLWLGVRWRCACLPPPLRQQCNLCLGQSGRKVRLSSWKLTGVPFNPSCRSQHQRRGSSACNCRCVLLSTPRGARRTQLTRGTCAFAASCQRVMPSTRILQKIHPLLHTAHLEPRALPIQPSRGKVDKVCLRMCRSSAAISSELSVSSQHSALIPVRRIGPFSRQCVLGAGKFDHALV